MTETGVIMLTDNEIRQAVIDGDLSVGYAFVPNGEGVWIYQEPAVDARDDPDGQALFNNLWVKSRVALTTGPLLKPLDYSVRVAGHLRFEGHDGVVDLRRTSGGYRIRPGEAALVLTNEQIDLSYRLGALMLGRVSSYSDGLVVNPSYLDPTWSGLIKLHIHNTSARPVTIRLGMEIGRLFLFDTAQSTPDPLAVAHQGLHYGYSWKRIFDDGIDPFPERAPFDERRRLAAGLSRFSAALKRNVGYTSAGAALLLAVPALRFYQQVDNWSERFDQLDQLEADVATATDGQPVSGIETLTWADGETATRSLIDLGDVVYDPASTFSVAVAGPVTTAMATDGGDPTVRTSVSRVGGLTRLTITAERGQPGPSQRLDVRWLVVP
ncbi:MAG: hypothetical protein OER95_09565 [Acidimicrobiia bacterium]|nr:hypothetical protein [Acidimicrobiia bacterium]